MSKARSVTKASADSDGTASAHCLCGAVTIEIEIPAFWAWHDHSGATRRAHGAAYATYVGSWRRRFRVAKGADSITRFRDEATGTTRSFCATCGTPLLYEQPRHANMVNIPRALFAGRTGREPRYHVAIGELQDWAYRGEPLVPLKGYPGTFWERPTRNAARKKRLSLFPEN